MSGKRTCGGWEVAGSGCCGSHLQRRPEVNPIALKANLGDKITPSRWRHLVNACSEYRQLRVCRGIRIKAGVFPPPAGTTALPHWRRTKTSLSSTNMKEETQRVRVGGLKGASKGALIPAASIVSGVAMTSVPITTSHFIFDPRWSAHPRWLRRLQLAVRLQDCCVVQLQTTLRLTYKEGVQCIYTRFGALSHVAAAISSKRKALRQAISFHGVLQGRGCG